jgi:alpha-1,6-mannosyltransferase
MKVVDVTSFFSDTCGGIKSYYRGKARVLPPRGVDCHFVVPGEKRVDEAFEGGTLHRLPGPRLGKSAYRCFGRFEPLMDLLAALRPDVIEVASHYLLPAIVRHAVRGLRSRPRVVGFYHADYPSTYVAPVFSAAPCLARGAERLAWRFNRWQHVRYDATLAASRFVASSLARNGVPRVHWVGLGVDVDTFAPQPRVERERPRCLYAGRLAAEKGFPLVLAAWDTIHARTGAALEIVGDGPLGHELRVFAATRPEIVWRGHVERAADVAAAMAAADLLIAPGPHETFSLATAEALACGTPVVGSDRGGNGELIDLSGGGLTFAADSSARLARAVVGFLSLPRHTRDELGAAGRAHVLRSLTWDHVAARLVAAYS